MAHAYPTRTSATGPHPVSFDATSADELRRILQHCSAQTHLAAIQFRHTRDPIYLPAIIYGLIERFVERSLRFHLQSPAETVRLREELGLDSLTNIELLMLADKVLELHLAIETPNALRTLADLQHYILSRIPNNPPTC